MKKLFPILLTFLMLTIIILPINIFAEDSFKLEKTSGVTYPSSKLELELQYTGETGISGFEFDALVYDSSKLTFEGGSTPIDNSFLQEKENGKHGFIFTTSLYDLDGVSGTDICFFKLTFTVKNDAEIGEDLTITLKDLGISDPKGTPLYMDDLIYRFTIEEKPKNTNCNLSELSTSQGAFTPKFDANSSNNNYAITVPHTVTELALSATTQSPKSTYNIVGNENFEYGENTVSITVTAESGAKRVYTINVTRLVPPSEDATLAMLTVSEGALIPEFSADIKEYTVNIPSDVLSLTLNIITSDDKANHQTIGNENFIVGENTVEIVVIAENGEIDKYIIKVTRARPIDTDASLSELSFGKYPFDLQFSSEQKQYLVTVPYEDDLTNLLTYTMKSPYAHASVSIPTEYVVGENQIVVTITAEDETTVETYTIIVNRQARILYADSTLQSLTASISGLNPAFSPSVYVYTLVTEPRCSSITFTAVANEFAATTEEIVIKEVKPGLNTVVLTCTAENGETSEYTIYIFVPVVEQQPQLILNGAPQIGEELTLTLVGDSLGGSYQWYLNDAPITSATTDRYILNADSEGKVIYAKYTDVNGSVLTSQTITVAVQKKQLILNGVPQVGEKLTLTIVGQSEGGSYKWYIDGQLVEGVTSDNYLLLKDAANKTIQAEYTDVDGTVLLSQTLTVIDVHGTDPDSQKLSTADIIIAVVVVVIAFLTGGFLGSLFFGKKSKKS